MKHARGWIVFGVVLLLLGVVRTIPTWQVRSGSAQVAEFIIGAGTFADYDTDIAWECDSYVATVRLPEGLDHWEYVESLGNPLTEIGFERLTHYEYQRDRADSLDFDTVSVEPRNDTDVSMARVHMSVFDTDSSFCIPERLAVRLS